jgi:hypothetical protein
MLRAGRSRRSILANLQEDSSIHARLLCLIAMGLLSALAGCGPAAVPTMSPEEIASIVGATQTAAPSLTPSPVVSPTRTPKPTLTSTPVPGTPAAPTRIGLLRGATSAVVSADIGAGETRAYVVRGVQAQPMLVQLISSAGDASLFMMSQGGTYFLRPGLAASWRGSLPQSGNYYLGVYGGSVPTDYTLSMQLATRIRFREGLSGAALSGKTPDGTIATYSLFAAKADQLTVVLSGTGQRAALNIHGFIDGKTYLSSSDQLTSLKLSVPVTQDYIIEIVPLFGETVSFVLDVQIQ